MRKEDPKQHPSESGPLKPTLHANSHSANVPTCAGKTSGHRLSLKGRRPGPLEPAPHAESQIPEGVGYAGSGCAERGGALAAPGGGCRGGARQTSAAQPEQGSLHGLRPQGYAWQDAVFGGVESWGVGPMRKTMKNPHQLGGQPRAQAA